MCSTVFYFFFFQDSASTVIYTLSLHDALPILNLSYRSTLGAQIRFFSANLKRRHLEVAIGTGTLLDRKSTRLNSSHGYISYAVFCLKKKRISPAWLAAA